MEGDMKNSDVAEIAARLKQRHVADEAERLERQRAAQLQAERAARNAERGGKSGSFSTASSPR